MAASKTKAKSNGVGTITEVVPASTEARTVDLRDRFVSRLAAPAPATPVPVKATGKKVAIVGFTDSRKQAPWSDPSFEKWICNNLHKFVPDGWDRLYDLHDAATIDGDKEHEAALRALKKPVYVWDVRPEWPTAVAYPKAEVTERFGRYFTNSISWMIAHALMEGASAIHVYGVDMAQGCLAPETRVLTADLRWVSHDEVRVGDRLVAFDEHAPGGGSYRRYRTATVEAVRRHVQPCQRIVFADGTKIIASNDHPWLVHSSNTRRWLETARLEGEGRKGRPSQVVRPFEPWEADRSWGAGYLSAAIDGEGHLSDRTLGFSQRENAFSRQVLHEASRRGFRFEGVADPTGCVKYQLAGGKRGVARFLGEIRPARLLAGFRPEMLGAMVAQGPGQKVPVVAIEDIGLRETIGLQVDTRTYIAEGFATHNTEYAAQRPSCEYFLGLAAGLGVDVFVPPDSDLMKCLALYGAEDDRHFRAKSEAREKELVERLGNMHNQHAQLTAQINQLNGALEDTRYWRGVWLNAHAHRDGSAKESSGGTT